MIQAGFKVEFESEDVAKQMVSTCKRALEGTGWAEEAESYRESVFVKTDTLLRDGDFCEEGFDEGDALVQKLCFALIEKAPQCFFTGIFLYRDDEKAIRVTVRYEKLTITYSIRTTTKKTITFQKLIWEKKAEGFEKSLLGSYRERERGPSCPQE